MTSPILDHFRAFLTHHGWTKKEHKGYPCEIYTYHAWSIRIFLLPGEEEHSKIWTITLSLEILGRVYNYQSSLSEADFYLDAIFASDYGIANYVELYDYLENLGIEDSPCGVVLELAWAKEDISNLDICQYLGFCEGIMMGMLRYEREEAKKELKRRSEDYE